MHYDGYRRYTTKEAADWLQRALGGVVVLTPRRVKALAPVVQAPSGERPKGIWYVDTRFDWAKRPAEGSYMYLAEVDARRILPLERAVADYAMDWRAIQHAGFAGVGFAGAGERLEWLGGSGCVWDPAAFSSFRLAARKSRESKVWRFL